ncbi:hypothetical protein CDAR_266341 [Caerostris darwini]|uniref:C2H2-type domain-containing protein n=1 Tax=Caerostris darwini TaxID=1538125 RepID=A0AAV4SED8_9ARAC|nr:hypothetical protein CDAR_266341 [Caerostris darwini]
MRPFACGVCDEVFNCRDDFDNHYIIHSIENPHVCNVCGKSFKLQRSLHVHSHTHSKKKPHSCYVCNLGFTRKYRLLNHYLSHYKKEAPSSEPVKKKRTQKTKKTARRRATASDKEVHMCDMCYMEFPNKHDLAKHYGEHFNEKPFKCPICNKGFSEQWRLSRHGIYHNAQASQ